VPASRLANETAPLIATAFEEHQARFAAITRRARVRFEARDWHAAVDDAVERLELYAEIVRHVEDELRRRLGPAVGDRDVWTGMKALYSGLVAQREDREIAETFFNSLTRRIFATAGVDPNIEFIHSDREGPQGRPLDLLRPYPVTSTAEVLERAVRDAWPDAAFADLRADARRAAERIDGHLDRPPDALEVVEAPFFRRKGAYLVGRLRVGAVSVPLALALLNDGGGIAIDAVLLGENDLSILFSFTRSHFHVDVGSPADLVAFLKQLMPRKPVAELYISIGFHKHGKTELYRDLLRYLGSSDEAFDLAPGTPGMVMVVFAMPGYDVAFKVIRDEFPPAKVITRQGVMRKYRLVFRHDRAGRLVEAQEFEHLRFPRSRFTPALLDELERGCARHVAVGTEDVVIHHAYVERRVVPLDVFIAGATSHERAAAVVDLGRSIKDLAATNIFPGDLLPKNFGLTRHGRIVCYDYDELSLLTDLSFREFPPSSAEDEVADEPWFGATPHDVFPEEFPNFVALPPDLREVFEARHRDLYDVGYWRRIQRRVAGGEIVDIFPYEPSQRLG
jgi:isocitrate dehydrogenase kinase/phosphatase